MSIDQFCDPLGDYNVWGTLYPVQEEPKKGDIVVAAAKVGWNHIFIVESSEEILTLIFEYYPPVITLFSA